MAEQAKEKNGRKQVDALHLIYLGIITGGLIVLLLSYIFGESVKAGSHLNFAATLISILLAVIAIVITLIDVAGQRSNIFDVKSSVEELKRVSGEIETMVTSFNVQNQESSSEIKEFIVNMATKNDEVLSQVNDIAIKLNNLPGEENNNHIAELKLEVDKLKNNLTSSQEKSKAISYTFDIDHIKPLFSAKELEALKMKRNGNVKSIKESLNDSGR